MHKFTCLSFRRQARVPILFICLYLCALSPAAAQQLAPTIGRLPTVLYIPGGGNGDRVETTASKPKQVKDLAELFKKGATPFATAKTPALTNSMAQSFVRENAKELGIEGNAGDFSIKSIRETMSGRYVSMEQRLNGVRVVDGHIQIKIADDGAIQSVTRNIVKIPMAKTESIPKRANLDENAAQEIAWQDLGVSGDLLESPKVEKAYLNEHNVLTLVYIVQLAVSKPFGYWEHYIDATTGRIISRKDRRIQEQKNGSWSPQPLNIHPAALVSSAEALKNLAKRKQILAAQATTQKNAVVSTASAMVFVPNPVSTLGDATLQDGDAAARFDPAYVKVALEGVKVVNGQFHLGGVLVRIEDFEPGENRANRAPSTAVSEWTARRGDNAFNDVMTYYHIHNSLMYLRKLGYVGAKDMFPAGIAADSDGVNGEDNSHYVPGSDKLAFGHGCVDDNEDADVILHELGHAIHFHINPEWGGGDSGAIGEGFGDYWAASHRMRMKNGWAFDAGKVFLWDGIDACWGGRRADRKSARYDESRTYEAHQQLGNVRSDEIWSTPLVSSLLELTSAGEAAESVDLVVLEGMAAIGRNFTMRSLALKTVEQARQMLPGKPHAGVFEKNFRLHRIVQ